MLKLSQALAGWAPAQPGTAEPLVLLEAGWVQIVGPDVAQNSHPVGIAGGTLTITTRSSAWSHQLTFLAEQVREAVSARLRGVRIERLRFRVGRIPQREGPAPVVRTGARRAGTRRTQRPAAATAAEALERFKLDVNSERRTRRSQGWRGCAGCGALIVPAAGPLCCACVAAQSERRAAATARLLFEAPWLGYAGTAALVDGLQKEEYELVRRRMLRHWWTMLAQARAAQRLSRDRRERAVASSYVVLQSKLPPEEILPETVASILGDELMDLLYGEALEGGVETKKKRKT
ncbi:MAG TPA: DUF721 domain-containing protein [Candidatus Babeliales bacterium]|nr:DUF721 domain-containing protein [Candidatus Babeliales bacterium]